MKPIWEVFCEEHAQKILSEWSLWEMLEAYTEWYDKIRQKWCLKAGGGGDNEKISNK